MDEVTQQNAALVEQAAAAAQSLQEQAVRLKEAVYVFKVADTGASEPTRRNPATVPGARVLARRASPVPARSEERV